jgi:hypothetical protein
MRNYTSHVWLSPAAAMSAGAIAMNAAVGFATVLNAQTLRGAVPGGYIKKTAWALVLATMLFLANTPSHADIACAGDQCACSGDKDCNDMFANLCSDTGGSCDTGKGECYCTRKASTTTSNPPKGTPHPVTTPVITGKPVEAPPPAPEPVTGKPVEPPPKGTAPPVTPEPIINGKPVQAPPKGTAPVTSEPIINGKPVQAAPNQPPPPVVILLESIRASRNPHAGERSHGGRTHRR